LRWGGLLGRYDGSSRRQVADATLDGKRKEYLELTTTVPLLILDDLGCASCR
jgi:hypothetical protein